MKRPHSAKPLSFAPQALPEEGCAFDEPRHFLKMGKRHMLSANSVGNDLSRLLPKKIQHDKEHLYHQNLQLKTTLNELTEENMKLKTKVALYQRQKDRLHKTDNHTLSKGKSSNNINPAAKVEKQNGIVNGLKKIVRETREENESLKADIEKLKKSLRYTKLNEVQVQKQTIYDENKKLAKLIQQYETELTSRVRMDRDIEQLEAELSEKTRTLKEVTTDNIKYEEILEQLELQYQQTSEKLLIQEKKWQRNFAVEKRKYEQLNKHVELLKAEVKSLTQKLEDEKKKNQQKKVVTRPASSHPYQGPPEGNKNKDLREKEEAMQANSRLKQELEQAKKRLMESESRLKNTNKNATNTLQFSKNQTFELNLTKEEPVLAPSKEEEEYGDDFEDNNSKVPQNVNSLPIDERPKIRSRPQPQQQKLSPIMSEIKQLLTYRLKYNRYTFQELQQDIEVSPDSTFTYEDLMSMLISQPFYLSTHYAEEFLRVCFRRTSIQNDDELELSELVQNLRAVVEDFELKDEEEEEHMLYKIAENLTKNRRVLEGEFAKLRDGANCVSKAQLMRVLRAVSRLSEEEIDLAICYVSINTETLQAISFTDFLDRFYINSSKSLPGKAASAREEELSMGENEELSEGELIGDDVLI